MRNRFLGKVPHNLDLTIRKMARSYTQIFATLMKDEGELVGLVTLTNVLAATDSFLRDDRHRIHANEILVGEVMVQDVATVDINASLRQAALFLEKHQIGCLPVIADGDLSGIITDTDFVAVAINLLEQLESTEPFDDEFDDLDVA